MSEYTIKNNVYTQIISTNDGEKIIIDKLLPCPFCGKDPEIKHQGNYHTKSRKFHIICKGCIKMVVGAITQDNTWCAMSIAKQWNTRQ